MRKKLKTYFNWSSGKDASLALYYLQKNKKYTIDKLLTSVNAFHDRVTMHGLRREVLLKQVEHIGIPLRSIELPEAPTMEVYHAKMESTVKELQAEGYTHTAFGDIFLEDLRAYRENQLKPLGIKACFPLWKKDTKALIHEFVDLGFKAVVVCIKSELLDVSFLGREIDASFVEDLPAQVDPCGENGEFHTFCYDGPIFKHPVQFQVGEHVFKEYKRPEEDGQPLNPASMGFWFCDLELIV